ncbi:MAG TPA: hypothetical protein VHQ65_12350 [Thermoanaerobaculia bacterium]|nr:hypothetical protein [Thermoanaerobaculia bacterium]
MADSRDQWKSKLGFVLAASGSAIGLGNVVFFGSNAYTYGFGAFYLPYLVALFVVGIPMLITELGLGGLTQQAFPPSLGRVGGRWGEMVGWFALLNASFITMYYITILAWVCGMFLGSFGPLWEAVSATPGYAMATLDNPQGFFFRMISTPWVVLLVLLVWVLNLVIVRRGATSIEPVVKIFVPLMWIFMLILVIRGVTLPHGEEGVYLLFTPDFQIMDDPAVWRGAVAQIFFSLTLGFGVMTAYASYLPRDADHTNNGLLTACLNCGFEYIAGLAIFSLLFAFAIVPSAGTLSMIFFVVPEGIAAMPWAVRSFGLVFFLLLVMAGLSSSISLIEGLNCAIIDKFGWSRKKTLLSTGAVGLVGSLLFALPRVIDPELAATGTVGFTLIDLIDHWAFGYGLLTVGLIESLMIGWLLPISRLREFLNTTSRVKIPAAFDWLVKVVIPALLLVVLGSSVWQEVASGAIYGWSEDLALRQVLPVVCFLVWLFGSLAVAAFLATKPGKPATPAPAGPAPHPAQVDRA